MAIQAVVFDAYGTLFDVHAAAEKHAARLGSNWASISALWRQKQLEYAWTSSLMGPAHHRDFWAITRASLTTAMLWHGGCGPDLHDALLETYRTLPAYPDVVDCLADLRAQGLRIAILSNGTRAMVESAVSSALIGSLVDEVISIDEARVYKPDPRVYRLAEDRFRLHSTSLGFVSSNAWDANAAAAQGFDTVWVNRIGQPVEHGLHQVARMVNSLADLPAIWAPPAPG